MSTRKLVSILAILAIVPLGIGCSDDDDDPIRTVRIFDGTAWFGIGQIAQPIQIIIDGDSSTFTGQVTTENVPDGPIMNGAWNGSRATWQTSEGGTTVNWTATLVNGELDGSIDQVEFYFETNRQ